MMQKAWGVLILCFSGLMTLMVLNTLYAGVSVLPHLNIAMLSEYITIIVMVMVPVAVFAQLEDPTWQGLWRYARWSLDSVMIPVLLTLLPFVILAVWQIDGSTIKEPLIVVQGIVFLVSEMLVRFVFQWLFVGFIVGQILKSIGI